LYLSSAFRFFSKSYLASKEMKKKREEIPEEERIHSPLLFNARARSHRKMR
jgi:hypothetical protein